MQYAVRDITLFVEATDEDDARNKIIDALMSLGWREADEFNSSNVSVEEWPLDQ